MTEHWPPLVVNRVGNQIGDGPLSECRCLPELADEFAPQQPKVVSVQAPRLGRQAAGQQVPQKRFEASHDLLARPFIAVFVTPTLRPFRQSRAIDRQIVIDYDGVRFIDGFSSMQLITLLNHCQRFPGFVYEKARLCAQANSIEVEVLSRRNSRGICSGCQRPGPTYDHLPQRRFEFVPFWGFMVLLLYCMRRIDCQSCGVKVEQVPWGCGKHQLTTAYMLFLANWARKLSWTDTARSFHTSWEKVCQSVEYVVAWGARTSDARTHSGDRCR